MYQLGFCESRDFERSIKNESRTFGKSLNRDVPNLTKMYTCSNQSVLSQNPKPCKIQQRKLKQLFFGIFPRPRIFLFFVNHLKYFVGLVTCIMTVGIGERYKQQTAKSASCNDGQTCTCVRSLKHVKFYLPMLVTSN